jgi:hypothetical protein
MKNYLVKSICANCGNEFFARRSELEKGRAKCCSRSCRNSYWNRGENNPNWKGGISKKYYHYKKLQVKRYPDRIRARNIISNRIKRGSIIREPCAICGSMDTEAHHEDYSKPLEVVWLCKKHHREKHDEMKLNMNAYAIQ